MDDVQKWEIHYQVTNVEDDYDQQHIEQQVYQLLWLVQHILLELQVPNQLNDQYDHVNYHKINDNEYDDNYLIVDRYKMMVHSTNNIYF